MLSVFILILVSAITGGAVFTAFRERTALRDEVNGFVAGIEARTTTEEENDPRVSDTLIAPELGELLDEALQTEHHNLAVLALNELTGRAQLARTRALSFSRGLSRVGLLSGAGGAFAVAALGHFETQALVFAGISVGLGTLCSFTCHGISARLRQLARRYGELTDVLAKQVDGHFKEMGRGE